MDITLVMCHTDQPDGAIRAGDIIAVKPYAYVGAWVHSISGIVVITGVPVTAEEFEGFKTRLMEATPIPRVYVPDLIAAGFKFRARGVKYSTLSLAARNALANGDKRVDATWEQVKSFATRNEFTGVDGVLEDLI